MNEQIKTQIEEVFRNNFSIVLEHLEDEEAFQWTNSFDEKELFFCHIFNRDTFSDSLAVIRRKLSKHFESVYVAGELNDYNIKLVRVEFNVSIARNRKNKIRKIQKAI